MKGNMVQCVAIGIAASALVGTAMLEASDTESRETNAAKDFEYEVYTSLEEASAHGEIYGRESYDADEILADVGEVSVRRFICINGYTAALYPEFADLEQAISNMETLVTDAAAFAEEYYGYSLSDSAAYAEDYYGVDIDESQLDWLSEENLYAYAFYLEEFLTQAATGEIQGCEEQTEYFEKVNDFLDIALDTLRNDEIIRMVEDMNSMEDLIYEDEAGVHLQIDMPSFVYEDGYLDLLAKGAGFV